MHAYMPVPFPLGYRLRPLVCVKPRSGSPRTHTQAFNEPSFLEDLTGLTAMKAAADELEFDWDDDGDDF